MRSMFAMLRARARASITTGREGTRFVTSTSEADKEQCKLRRKAETQKALYPAQGRPKHAPLDRGGLWCINHDDTTTTAR